MAITLTDLQGTAKELAEVVKKLDSEINVVSGLEDKQRFLQEDALPGMMEELGLRDFKLDDGTVFALADDFHPSWPKDPNEAAKAAAQLEKLGYGDVIRIEVVMAFPKEQAKLAALTAKKAAAFVKSQKGSCEIDITRTVHHSTLKRVVKECYEKGASISDTLFGVFHRTLCTITLPGLKKAAKPKRKDS